MTFRSRTVLTIVVLTALALGGAFAAVSAAFNHLQRTQLDASLLSVAQQEAREAPLHHFSFSDRPGPAANDVGPLTKYGIIFDERGRVLSATSPFDERSFTLNELRRPQGQAFDFWFQQSHFRGVLVPIPSHPGRWVFLATSRDDLDGDERFLYHAVLVAFLVAVFWVGAVAYWMAGRLTLAHRDIANVVRRVTSGDLAARVSVKASDPEVDRLGREINEMVARLDELLKSQQRFIAHAAHELRTPLAAIYGELQQARRKPRDAPYYEQTIDAALDATRHLTSLAEDLLTLAKTRTQARTAAERVPLANLVDGAWSLVGSLARDRRVSISLAGALTETVPDSNGDTMRLLRNILENAIRHSPAGGTVRVSASRAHGAVEVRVSDQGRGVAELDREAIFEPFFRSVDKATGEGAGLGLGIAREIARAHGGDLTLDPSTSGGACFVVAFDVIATR